MASIGLGGMGTVVCCTGDKVWLKLKTFWLAFVNCEGIIFLLIICLYGEFPFSVLIIFLLTFTGEICLGLGATSSLEIIHSFPFFLLINFFLIIVSSSRKIGFTQHKTVKNESNNMVIKIYVFFNSQYVTTFDNLTNKSDVVLSAVAVAAVSELLSHKSDFRLNIFVVISTWYTWLLSPWISECKD